MVKNNVTINSCIERLFGNIFDNSDITEIIINHQGLVIYEDSTGFKFGTEEENSRVTKSNIEQFANALAVYSNQNISEKMPIMGGTLPGGERVQVIRPPALDQGQYSITIRKPSYRNLTLDDYQKSGFFDSLVMEKTKSPIDIKLAAYLDQSDFSNFLKYAVETGEKNIIIVGETGSGKTTLMKALIDFIPGHERLVTIEDTRELFLRNHKNFVNLTYPQGATFLDSLNATTLLKSSLRMRPDRILLAELRGGETFDYINAVSSGHGGSITSLHAGSVEEAFMRLSLMFLQNETGSKIPYETVKSIIENTIDIVLIIGFDANGQRRIKTLHWKDYKKEDLH